MPTMPKRSEELQRPRERKGVRDPITYGQLLPVDESKFVPDEDWHPTARMIWDSAFESGQSTYYQESDLALLYLACEEISRYKLRPSAVLFKEIMAILTSLLMSEGSRRMARVELQRPVNAEIDLAASAMDTYGDLFSKKPKKAAQKTS